MSMAETHGYRLELAGGIARLELARPERHNAFDDRLIAGLTSVLETLAADPAVRVVVVQAAGPSFSAGADAGWMQRMASYDEADNIADARGLARLLAVLDELPKPTIARVQGPAIGGGVGLVACCDIAVASERAFAQLSEVRLGLIPATISPYVLRAIGGRTARRYFLTAERIDAAEALRIGLFHMVVPEAELDDAIDNILNNLALAGPVALAESKRLIADMRDQPPAQVAEETARRIASTRAGAEGREGLAAFLAKRAPSWRRPLGQPASRPADGEA